MHGIIITNYELSITNYSDQVLAFATIQGWAVLTVNRDDFIRLHRISPDHAGIIVCTEDFDRQRLATRIHETITSEESLFGKLVRVNRPPAVEKWIR